jgi:hypothetical protein
VCIIQIVEVRMKEHDAGVACNDKAFVLTFTEMCKVCVTFIHGDSAHKFIFLLVHILVRKPGKTNLF